MQIDLRQFTIDDYLKRYKQALTHLSKYVPPKTFNDVLEYVKKHQLYHDAMNLYKENREQYDVLEHYHSLIIDHSWMLWRLSLRY